MSGLWRQEGPRGMPFATLQPLHDEQKRLHQLAPDLAEAVDEEMLDVVYPDLPADMDVDSVEAELRPLAGWPHSVVKQAGIVQALLRQYEGRESRILAGVLEERPECDCPACQPEVEA